MSHSRLTLAKANEEGRYGFDKNRRRPRDCTARWRSANTASAAPARTFAVRRRLGCACEHP